MIKAIGEKHVVLCRGCERVRDGRSLILHTLGKEGLVVVICVKIQIWAIQVFGEKTCGTEGRIYGKALWQKGSVAFRAWKEVQHGWSEVSSVRTITNWNKSSNQGKPYRAS